MTSAAPLPPLTGIWSGDRATLTLTDTGGSFDGDGWSGTLEAPLHPDADNRFAATLHREIDTVGPQAADRVPVIVAVRITGHRDGDTLVVEVAAPDAATESYRLAPGRNFKRVRML